MAEEKKPEDDSVFLRTLIRKDIYDRLQALAKRFSTGNGHWDFGVAIQILLDHYDESKQAIQSEKIDAILGCVMQIVPAAPKEEEQQEIELLGGAKEPKPR